MCSNDNVTQVLPWVTEESKWNAIMEELQRMKNSVNQNQISHSLIIYCMLQLTLLLKGTAEGRWLGARCYSTWLRNISPFVIKTLRVSHSPCPRRGWTPSPLWDKGALVFSCNMENNHNSLWDVTIRWFYWATSEPTQKSRLLYLATYSWQAVRSALSSWGSFVLWAKRMKFGTPESLTYLICLKQPTAYSLTYWSG